MKVENSDKEVMENVSSVMAAEARSLFIPGVLFLVCICINFPVVKEKVAHLLWEEPKVTSLVSSVSFVLSPEV